MERPRIIVNKAQCLECMDIIESKTVHDFISCKCGASFVDGGKEYIRRGGPAKNLSIYERLI